MRKDRRVTDHPVKQRARRLLAAYETADGETKRRLSHQAKTITGEGSAETAWTTMRTVCMSPDPDHWDREFRRVKRLRKRHSSRSVWTTASMGSPGLGRRA